MHSVPQVAILTVIQSFSHPGLLLAGAVKSPSCEGAVLGLNRAP